MDASTLDLLRVSLTKLLGEHGEASLAHRLATLGWDEVLDDDAPTATRLLFEVRGSTLSDADALGPLLAQAMAGATDRPELAGAIVLIPASLHPRHCSAAVVDGLLRVEGVAWRKPVKGTRVVVPLAGPDEESRLAIVPGEARWSTTNLSGLDETHGLRIYGEALESELEWVAGPNAVSSWEAASTAGRWALAAELAAIGRAVIGQAVEYTAQRKQYGRPIGTFQALQHRLASAHASVIGAEHLTAEASMSATPWDALVAKAAAGKAAENACAQAQQCYGAIGFTWEHPFHRYLRRTYILDRLLGDWRTLEAEIGAAVATCDDMPKIGSI
jgi:hypothetical protein